MPLDELPYPIEVSMTDCRHCRISIPKRASVCPHCKKSQGSLKSKLESAAGIVPVVSIFLSIVLVALSVAQFREATKQRKSADRAFQLADEARAQANVAKGEAVRARDEARSALELFRSAIKLMLEREAALPKILSESADTVKGDRLTQKLKEFAVPDEKERQKWDESLKTKTK